MKEEKYCTGCGVKLQNNDENILGYVDDLSKKLCMRCFKLINYGVYQGVNSEIIDYQKIFNKIKKTKSIIIYVVDILNIPNDIDEIIKNLGNKWILVLNKRDLLPLSVKEEKIKKYFNNLNLGYLDIEIISTNKNINMDHLINKIYQYANNQDVYVIGNTNAGKSSLINKIIKNYGDNNYHLTISNIPSTTLDSIRIKINDKLTLVDTPGIVDKNNIINYVDSRMYKKLNSKKEIKPKTFKVQNHESLIIDNILRINYLSYNENSFTFYIPNEIDVKRVSINNDILSNINKKIINIDSNTDLVINGLGFIKIVNKCRIEVYLDEKITYFTRNNLI